MAKRENYRAAQRAFMQELQRKQVEAARKADPQAFDSYVKAQLGRLFKS